MLQCQILISNPNLNMPVVVYLHGWMVSVFPPFQLSLTLMSQRLLLLILLVVHVRSTKRLPSRAAFGIAIYDAKCAARPWDGKLGMALAGWKGSHLNVWTVKAHTQWSPIISDQSPPKQCINGSQNYRSKRRAKELEIRQAIDLTVVICWFNRWMNYRS